MSNRQAQPAPTWTRAALEHQVAIVVGGSRGIGLALAQALDRLGCRVTVAARGAAQVKQAIASMRHAAGHAGCDVRRAEDVQRVFDDVLSRHQQIDLVINSAGIGRASQARLVPDTTARLDEAEWQEVVDTNLRGGFLVARCAARAMIPRRQGQIVNISSARGAIRGQPFAAGYCATKMACLAMFHALAEELRPLGVRAWSLLPEAVDTDLIAGTQLAKRGLLSAERLADTIVEMLALPVDSEWSDPLVAPMGSHLALQSAEVG